MMLSYNPLALQGPAPNAECTTSDCSGDTAGIEYNPMTERR